MDRLLLEQHYDRILSVNRTKILSGGAGDDYLKNVRNDNRMSLVVLIRITPEISGKIVSCIEEIRKIEPELYFYPAGDFHITVMDILKGEEGRNIPENVEEYIDCIRKSSAKISPFPIEFKGLTASDNAVMVKGYYQEELLWFREDLRESFAQRGLKLEERYKTISSHVTISRLPERYQNAEALLNYIKQPRAFGTMNVHSMEVSFHNWYDTRKEVLSVINL